MDKITLGIVAVFLLLWIRRTVGSVRTELAAGLRSDLDEEEERE